MIDELDYSKYLYDTYYIELPDINEEEEGEIISPYFELIEFLDEIPDITKINIPIDRNSRVLYRTKNCLVLLKDCGKFGIGITIVPPDNKDNTYVPYIEDANNIMNYIIKKYKVLDKLGNRLNRLENRLKMNNRFYRGK